MSTANCDRFIVNWRLQKGVAIALNLTILKQNMADYRSFEPNWQLGLLPYLRSFEPILVTQT